MFRMYLKLIFSPVHPKPVQYALRLGVKMKPSPAHLIFFFFPLKILVYSSTSCSCIVQRSLTGCCHSLFLQCLFIQMVSM